MRKYKIVDWDRMADRMKFYLLEQCTSKTPGKSPKGEYFHYYVSIIPGDMDSYHPHGCKITKEEFNEAYYKYLFQSRITWKSSSVNLLLVKPCGN